MKNTYKFWIILFTLVATSMNMNAAITYSLDNRCGTSQLVVLVTPDMNYSGAFAVWSPAVFTISWPMALGTGVLGTISNQNGFSFGTAGALGNDGINYYQKYAHTASPTLTMVSGTSYEVTRIALVGGVGVFGNFEIPTSTNVWVSTNNGLSVCSNSNGNQVVSPYSAASLSSIPLFAGIFWDGTSWCGGSGTSEQPGATDGALNCYINGMGAQLTTSYLTPAVVSNLTIAANSQLTIMPGAAMTIPSTGITTINSAQGLVIASDNTGSGSFKNSYTVANTIYGIGGSATVQSFLKNTQSVGSFQIHLIGPTVFDPAIFDPPTTGPGCIQLSAFDMPGNTYAYRYREVINNWSNVYNLTDSIPRMGGIALSDGSGGGSRTISLTGKLNTGTVVDPTSPTTWDPTITAGQGNGLYLFSNPYPCYMDLSRFYADNNAVGRLGGNWTFWTWEHENGTYGTWYWDDGAEVWDGVGHISQANGIINPGQGFFAQLASTTSQVRATSSSTIDLERVHGHTPFLKSEILYSLRLNAAGNYTNDELLIKFRTNATTGYDEHRDIEKWFSMYEEATEIFTLSTDQTMLTVNALPTMEPGQMVNVPMSFKCGAEGTYTITASNIESFEEGTEIWLEDLQTGGEWYSLNANQVYEFTATLADPQERFIVHFFGPTGIDDPQAEINAVSIYGYGQDAYIVNRGNETIKEYVAYDMMGRELHRGTLPNNTVNKVRIGNVSAYYIVKVITREGTVYTDKVYISK